MLEGLEIVFIVITFGIGAASANTTRMEGVLTAAAGAALAFIAVVILGVIVKGPLSNIPENTLKYAVGLMLVSFGAFWAGEGLGLMAR